MRRAEEDAAKRVMRGEQHAHSTRVVFRPFVVFAIDDEVWDQSVFSMNRDRLLEHALVERFFTEVGLIRRRWA